MPSDWTDSALDRFWEKIDVSDPQGCWRWTGALRNGYGVFMPNTHRDGDRKLLYSHRMMFSLMFGDIEDEIVHHDCGNRWCVNPFHLHSMSRHEHIRLHGRDPRGLFIA